MAIDFVVAVTEGNQFGDMDSLAMWLRQEPELRGRIHIAPRVPDAGEMGSVVDAITVAVGGGGSVSVLAMSLRTWLAQPRRSDVSIRIRHSDGRSVTVDAKRVGDVEALLRSILDTDE
ncbi:hypothetical protein [Nocardia sp. NPDC059228]|uniref:effector-associated constant component EACC1 n=1 Tax=Nocardia sp. NPDC059228 TaxID=3346777 RepID=UPI00368E26E2